MQNSENNWFKEVFTTTMLTLIDKELEADTAEGIIKAEEVVVAAYDWLERQNHAWNSTEPLYAPGYAIKEHCDPRLATTLLEKRRRIITCYIGLQGHIDRGELI